MSFSEWADLLHSTRCHAQPPRQVRDLNVLSGGREPRNDCAKSVSVWPRVTDAASYIVLSNMQSTGRAHFME